MTRYTLILAILLVFVLFNMLMWIISFPKQKMNEHNLTSDNAILDRMSIEMKKDILSGMLTGMADPSLEMRENVDFLLTPAILVQQCISEGVLITYPEE